MTELRFDGRVAVVTGAGRGIGRAYAHLLAERGARVVVNDLGSSVGGAGANTTPADRVVAEIQAAGGEALADGSDISTAAGGATAVAAATERFGRIDIVINNAGIMRWARLPELHTADVEAHLAVHLLGSFHTARAAWPHMVAAGYGRIVNTASAGVFGLPNNTAYAAAKGGVIGLTRSLALTGARRGIKVNVIAPAAMTRMAAGPSPATGASLATGTTGVATDSADDPEHPDDDLGMPPALVAPMVAYLAHESCPVSGEIYAAGAGRFARIFLATTPGYLHTGAPATVEDVAANWAAINDEADYLVPAHLIDWSAAFTAHLQPPATDA